MQDTVKTVRSLARNIENAIAETNRVLTEHEAALKQAQEQGQYDCIYEEYEKTFDFMKEEFQQAKDQLILLESKLCLLKGAAKIIVADTLKKVKKQVVSQLAIKQIQRMEVK